MLWHISFDKNYEQNSLCNKNRCYLWLLTTFNTKKRKLGEYKTLAFRNKTSTRAENILKVSQPVVFTRSKLILYSFLFWTKTIAIHMI